jgi:hypothetical protein
MTVDRVPSGRTAQRLEWRFLPRHVRALVEERCGSAVAHAESMGGGFTPGFASVLTCEDGSHHFVKAASVKAQRPFADSYREEARKLAALPEDVPAPRLLWSHDDDWVVLGIEYVEASLPARPWRVADLERCLDAVERVADVLTPAPDRLELQPIAEEFGAWPAYWDRIRRRRPGLPHLESLARLAVEFADVTAGDTVVHTDVRDDNLLLTRSGDVLICDWNWPIAGAPWIDTLLLLIGPRGDGIDVDEILATRRLTRDVPPDHLDRMLALVTGYFLHQADQPVPPSSPWVRQGQAWQGEVCRSWLAERRGWA